VPRGAREAYRLDRLASVLAGIYLGAIFPFLGVIARDRLHADPLMLSLMSAAPFLGNLFALLMARAMEGRSALPFMIWCQILARSVFFLMVFATTPLRFALIVSAAQLVATLSSPAYAAVIKEIYPDDQRGRIMSYTRAALLTASVVITFVAGLVLEWVSYRWVFPIAALFGIGASIVFSRVPVASTNSDLKVQPSETRAPVRETLRFLWETFGILRHDLRFRWFALSVFTYGFGNLMLMPVIPIVQVDQLGISTGSIASLANLSQVVAAGAYFYWGRYIDAHSPVKAVVLNIFLNLFIPLCYYFAENVWYLVPAFLLSGITMAGIDLSYFNTVLRLAREQNTARYQALQSFLLGIRGTVAPFVGGVLLSLFRQNGWNIRDLFLIALGFLATGCWMQFVGLRHTTAEGNAYPADQ
jgi:MFS family permease